MAIYGVALLAGCLVIGTTAGRLLGSVMGLDKDVGGVGIAMVLLLVVTGWLRKRGSMPAATQSGILFWSAVYIPIVVAMAACQDVAGAIGGGAAAITAGVVSVAAAFAMVPVLSRLTGGAAPPLEPPPEVDP